MIVTFIDVGQGDSSLLSTSSGFDILLDGGPRHSGDEVLSYLTSSGVDDLEVVVISHQDADHIGGLIDVFQSTIEIDSVIYNGNACTTNTCQSLWGEVAKRGITPIVVDAGDTFNWGPITTTVLNPQITPTGDENEDSVVMELSFSDVGILYTGDIGDSTENILLNQGVLNPVDNLKVAHHGSKNSTSMDFFYTTTPENAVISVGQNSYGHPA